MIKENETDDRHDDHQTIAYENRHRGEDTRAACVVAPRVLCSAPPLYCVTLASTAVNMAGTCITDILAVLP